MNYIEQAKTPKSFTGVSAMCCWWTELTTLEGTIQKASKHFISGLGKREIACNHKMSRHKKKREPGAPILT